MALSTLGANVLGGAAGGAAGNVLNQVTERLIHGVGEVARSEPVKEAINKIVKQRVPKAFGIGHTEEAEFYSTLNLLAPADQERVRRVADNVRKHKVKHLQRWWLILATKTVEGQMWDPQGPMIIPSLQQKTSTDVWGLHHKKPQGKSKGPVPVEGTPADPRVIALQAIADMVRQPHGSSGDIKLFDRDGNEKLPINGDSNEAVEHAAEHLRTTILEDYHFYSNIQKWWNDTEILKTVLEKTRTGAEAAIKAINTQVENAFMFWVKMEIGEENLKKILMSKNPSEEKAAAIEKCLQEAIEAKQDKIAKTAFWNGPARLVIIGFGALLAGTVIISLLQVAAQQ